MSDESRLQWLSHYLIAGYLINTEYIIKEGRPQSKSLDSYLKNRSIFEKIIININVNYNQLTKVEKPCKCNKSSIINVNKDYIEIKIGKEICKSKKECNFMCKCMHVKMDICLDLKVNRGYYSCGSYPPLKSTKKKRKELLSYKT